MNGNIRRLAKAYVQRLFEDKKKRLEISQRSYIKHISKKVKQFHKDLDNNYNGDVVNWERSKDSDNHRQLNNIIQAETL